MSGSELSARREQTVRLSPPAAFVTLAKVSTGIVGLDEVLNGGVPKGRPTLLRGGPGCGKTILAAEFLCRGVLAGEAGVFISFEESAPELVANVSSLGFDLQRMQSEQMLVIEGINQTPETVVETGEYDLDALLIRIGLAADSVNAQRIVIDGIETLFGRLQDPALLRSELRRLFLWIKASGMTAMVTSERGDEFHISRFGIEEYVSDCVIVLENRIAEEHSTRRLRVVKFRGSPHGSDEHPFVITNSGVVVIPITSHGAEQEASAEKLSTGISRLDAALDGGIYRASSILISGPSGVGKTSIAAQFADVACQRGERTLFLSYEESESQLIRNMRSIGIDLERWVKADLLRVESIRPTFYSLEAHLIWLSALLEEFEPSTIISDPITSMAHLGTFQQTSSMMIRKIDLLKTKGVTALFTALTSDDDQASNQLNISSLIDTWIALDSTEANRERTRHLTVMKSRGAAHSHRIMEYSISSSGIELLEPPVTSRWRAHRAASRAAREKRRPLPGKV